MSRRGWKGSLTTMMAIVCISVSGCGDSGAARGEGTGGTDTLSLFNFGFDSESSDEKSEKPSDSDRDPYNRDNKDPDFDTMDWYEQETDSEIPFQEDSETPTDTEGHRETDTEDSDEPTDYTGDAGDSGIDEFDTEEVEPAVTRKAICVIADFADTTLEDFQGDGVKSEADMQEILDEMEAYWRWLGRGREKMQWDIVRVILPEPLSENAYEDIFEYINAVIALLRDKVSVGDYDMNGDGSLDSVWIVAANNGKDFPFLSDNFFSSSDAEGFVDVQDADNLTSKAVGFFTYLFGATLGVPSLYGDFSTICGLSGLSVMADCFASPPLDFTAWERKTLGWLEPRVIDESTIDVTLLSADENFDAVIIPTMRPYEYFILEHRVTPDSGFGSSAPEFDGVAVYHILETSDQYTLPPLMKLESADGSSVDNTARETYLLYPENPDMLLPFTVRSYYGDAEVFRIDNVRRISGGIQFDVDVLPHNPSVGNMISNSSFEAGSGSSPTGWSTEAWESADATFSWDTADMTDGERSLAIENSALNDARWYQEIGGLASGDTYEFCGWLKGENIVGEESGIGANLSIVRKDDNGNTFWNNTSGGFGTFDYRRECISFVAEENIVARVECALGHWGNTVTGKMWCDNLTLYHLTSAF